MALLNVIAAAALCVWFIAVGECDLIAMPGAETPPQDQDCSSALVSVGGCIAFVTGQSLKPSAECCSGVLDVHLHMPVCLCELAERNGTTGSIPDYKPDLAAQLPTLCNIQGASISECPALLGQIPANTTAPAGEGTPAPTSQVPGSSGTYKLMISSTYSAFICLGVALSSLLTFQ